MISQFVLRMKQLRTVSQCNLNDHANFMRIWSTSMGLCVLTKHLLSQFVNSRRQSPHQQLSGVLNKSSRSLSLFRFPADSRS
jgi:hypothetical protein